MITCYYWPLKGMPEAGEIRLIHFTPSFVSNFPVQVFAFTCSQNVSLSFSSVSNYILIGFSPPNKKLFPIYNELKNNSQARMNIVIGGSIGAATLTYEIIAVFGYLTFGSKVRLRWGVTRRVLTSLYGRLEQILLRCIHRQPYLSPSANWRL